MASLVTSSLRSATRSRTGLTCRRCLSSSSKKSTGETLPPLPSSSSSTPSQAKATYLKSQKATEKYLDPQLQIQQNLKEIELVREQAAAKLEKELKKSIWKRITDPLKNHKHSLYNILAMSLAYILAHNLYVTSKKEKEARSQLVESQQTNEGLKHLIESLLEDSTLNKMASNLATQVEQENSKDNKHTRSLWWLKYAPTVEDTKKEMTATEITLKLALETELKTRIGHVTTASEDERKQQSIQELMQQNQQQVKALNENPEYLLQQALESAEQTDEGTGNKKKRRIFSM